MCFICCFLLDNSALSSNKLILILNNQRSLTIRNKSYQSEESLEIQKNLTFRNLMYIKQVPNKMSNCMSKCACLGLEKSLFEQISMEITILQEINDFCMISTTCVGQHVLVWDIKYLFFVQIEYPMEELSGELNTCIKIHMFLNKS